MARSSWTDLLDPDEAELRKHMPKRLRPDALRELLRPADPDGGNFRPSIRSHGDYIFGLLTVAVALPEEDRIFFQEVDIVVTKDQIFTVRKTPGDLPPFDPKQVEDHCEAHDKELSPGAIAYHLVDEVAENFLDLLDAVDDEIDELEEHIDEWSLDQTRHRISTLRHDLLHIRKTLAPTRDAVREIVSGAIDIDGRTPFTREVFPREIEQQFATTYDKLLRSSESIEYARDLIGAVRDYQQAKVSIDQNEVTKKLTAIASILLVPTFIVGLYGQNFIRSMPELKWQYGYWWSWSLIIVTTVFQVTYFRRKGWL